jgi:fructokinase
VTDPALVIGESLIDIVSREGATPIEHVGGSPTNVALGLGRLGVPVRLRTALGRDARGERIEQHLAASGVEVEPESFVLEHTSTALARISEQGNATYEFDIEWRIGAAVALRDARVVHIGSIGCFIEPGATTVREAVASWSTDAAVTFDPNIRPALVGSREDAVRTTEALAALSDVVKLSDEDAAWLCPGAGVDQVIARFLELGAQVVAVTAGGDGAVLASADARVEVRPPAVQVKDTVGAGDTFMASLVASLAEHRLDSSEASMRAAGDRAARAAAITVSRDGADLPTCAELDAPI